MPKGKNYLLITGASGFIGKRTVKHFLNQGFKVKAFARNKDNIKFVHKNLVVAEGDMKDYNSLYNAMDEVDAVIHLAAAKSDEKDSYEVNVEGAKNLVKSCLEKKVKKIVNISTASTKIKVRGAYGDTKSKADDIIMSSRIPSVTLKPSVVYGDKKNGVFGSLVKFSLFPLTPVIGDGRCIFRPIHVDDLAKSMQIALESKKLNGKSYDVGGPDKISLDELISKISKDLIEKEKTRIIHIPVGVGMFMAKVFSKISSRPPITASNILGSTQDVEMNVEEYFKDFKFKPRSLNEGLIQLKSEEERSEAKIIFEYISSWADSKVKIDEDLVDRYYIALKNHGIESRMSILFYNHPFLLGAFDCSSKIRYPSGKLQKRIKIALTLLECHPSSAEWLLPKERKKSQLLLDSMALGMSGSIKLILSLVLLIVPGLVRKHAE